MGKAKELSIVCKSSIVALRQQNIPFQKIATIVQKSKSAVIRTWQNFCESGSFQSKSRSGRPNALSPRTIRKICTDVTISPFLGVKELTQNINEATGSNVCDRTVRRILSKNDLASFKASRRPLLTKRMMLKRKLWCLKYSDWTIEQWKNVIFTDETMMRTFNNKNVRVRRPYNAKYDIKYLLPTVKHPIQVMIWGCIYRNMIGDIVFLEKTMNSERYSQIIKENVMEFVYEVIPGDLSPDVIYQDDSAPCHRAKAICKIKEDLGIISLDWPGNSPDLNPIENIWSILKRKVQIKKPTSTESLMTAVKAVWTEENLSLIVESAIESMPKRIQQVLERKGGHCDY